MTPAERVRLELLDEFRKGAADRLDRITAAWVALEVGETPPVPPQALLRELHTLKGEAKLMGFGAVSRLVHHIEEAVLRAVPDGKPPSAALAELVLRAIDVVAALVRAPDGDGEGGASAATVNEFVSRLDAALAGLALPPAARVQQAAPPAAPTAGGAASKAGLAPAPAPAPASEGVLRVDARVARALADGCADAVVRHARYAHSLAGARAAAAELAALAGAAGAAVAARLGGLLERLDEDVHQGGVAARELDGGARRLRLVPLGPVLRLQARAVRDLAREHGKRAVLDVQGAEVSLDRAVIDRVAEPLVHLVRNAVDHGLERPEERAAAGKPETGRITLAAHAAGDEVLVVVEDDGRGIDAAAVARRAQGLGLVPAGRVIADAEAYALLFAPGFSTRTEATETSGRGVGLDVVKRQIEGLGGTVRVDSRPGAGTRFELRVPVSVSLTRALLVRQRGARYAVPAAAVESIIVVDDAQVAQVHTRRTVPLAGERVALVDLAAALDLPPSAAGGAGAPLAPRAVVVRHEDQRVALEVEGVDGDVEVIVKPLGGACAPARVVLGGCVLGDGELAIALAPSELVARALGELPRVRAAAASSPRRAAETRVLLAEDSAITRSMMARLLRMLGYVVREAEDGARALAALEEDDADLLITDVEMPNLDGIELITRVRAVERWKRMPVVVLSTRGSAEDKSRALRAGANAYLVKTEFSEGALREVLGRHLERA